LYFLFFSRSVQDIFERVPLIYENILKFLDQKQDRVSFLCAFDRTDLLSGFDEILLNEYFSFCKEKQLDAEQFHDYLSEKIGKLSEKYFQLKLLSAVVVQTRAIRQSKNRIGEKIRKYKAIMSCHKEYFENKCRECQRSIHHAICSATDRDHNLCNDVSVRDPFLF
jgi:hypothetical protein